ncbi:MAG TPA: hypothetical protein VLM79_06030 [Kofleriaceae bacterium]|nr:hypothetical protein [Kofleriaceae bacterium]
MTLDEEKRILDVGHTAAGGELEAVDVGDDAVLDVVVAQGGAVGKCGAVGDDDAVAADAEANDELAAEAGLVVEGALIALAEQSGALFDDLVDLGLGEAAAVDDGRAPRSP